MTSDLRKEISQKYCPRLGQLAVEFGFITQEQLIDALTQQVREELDGKGHRMLGQILFERDVMSAAQIEQVTTEMFRRMRKEQDGIGSSAPPL